MKIEKNIPIPDRLGRLHGGKYGIVDEMEVGDSVLFNDSVINAATTRARSKNPGKIFSTRKEGDAHTRLWRIE